MAEKKTIKKVSQKRYSSVFVICMAILSLIGGLFLGMVFQQQLFYLGLVQVANGLEGTTFNIEVEVDLNETLMVDRVTENMEPIIWSSRMQNCTRTENNYCAIECYENKKLIPCENFTADEYFCSNGICEINEVCPDYFEILEGKTISDCINEIEQNDKFYNDSNFTKYKINGKYEEHIEWDNYYTGDKK